MQNTLYYTKCAKHFEEALPTGNGRMGAMIYGNLKKETILLNEDSLWSGYPVDFNKKDAYKFLPSAREAIFAKDYKKAKEIINRDMHGHWSEAYLPFGNLIIEYGNINKHNYSRKLNIAKGLSTVSTDGFCQTTFVSHPDQLIVVNIKSDNPISFKAYFDSKLKHQLTSVDNTLFITGKAPEVCMPPYYKREEAFAQGDKGMEFCGGLRVIGNAKITSNYVEITNEKEVTLLISLATSFVDFKSMPTADAKARCISYFKDGVTYKELKHRHVEDFSKLFDRVNFELKGGYDDLPTDKRLKLMHKKGDDYSLIALLFQYGRYLTISGSRPGTNAMTLQGIWNEHVRAPWSSSYTLNINTQMNYWPTDITNLSECFQPLLELQKKLAYNGKTTAKDYFGVGGFVSFHNSDIWGNTYPAGYPHGDGNSETYAFWGMSSPWILNQIYDHYLYTKDESLKSELITLFSGALEFYKESLANHNGELVTCPSLSPENTFVDGSNRCALSYMPSMDREILHDFFNNCRELGLDAPKVDQVAVASDGRIPEWAEEYGETEKTHRHSSHLYCIYPSNQVQSKELKQAAEKSLDVRGFGGTGWALGWKVCLWARLENAENAFALIKNQLRPIKPASIFKMGGGGSYPNMFDAHPPFQIDGNFGVTAGIAEMLKSRTLPKEWSGKISGLKTYDGEISYTFKNGKEI